MWELVDESLRRNVTSTSSKVALPRYLLNAKWKIVTLPWRNPAGSLSVVLKLTSSKAHWHPVPPARGTRRTHHACGLHAKVCDLSLLGKHPTNPYWGTVYKITDEFSSEVSKPWQTRKDYKEWSHIEEDYRDIVAEFCVIFWNRMLGRKVTKVEWSL